MTGLPWDTWDDSDGDEPGTWYDPGWVNDEWPEHLAGPEYWLWKKEGDDDLRPGQGG